MNERTGDLTFDLSHEGELRVGARLRSAADLDRFVDSLYHVGFLLWPKEITELAAGEDAGDRPAMMRAGAGIAAEPPKTAADKPAGGAPRVEPLPAPESERPATGRGGAGYYKANPGGRAQPIKIGALEFPSKGKAILHCLKTGRPDADIIRLCNTTAGSIASVKKEARASGELRR